MAGLKSDVGRALSSGRSCMNRTEDQQLVVELLNRVSADEGGADGVLSVYRVPGYAEPPLCRAIVRFQRRHFPREVTGVIAPKSAVFARLQLLAAREATAPTPPPLDTGLWDTIPFRPSAMPSGGVVDRRPVVSQADAVNVIRSALEAGWVGPAERAAILALISSGASFDAPSKAMLQLFVDTVHAKRGGAGPFSFASPRHCTALDIACDFLRRPGGSAHWPLLTRHEVGIGMLMRIGKPSLLQQGGSSLCGPASLLFNMLEDQPDRYARFVTDLYETGKGMLGRLEIKPGHDVRHHRPPPRGENTVEAVDWLTFAGIRDSENWFFDYDEMEDEFAGITLPNELGSWFRRAGYREVKEEANILITKGADNLAEADRLYKAGWRVCLFINSNMLHFESQTKGSVTPDHWVVLRSPVVRTGVHVSLTIFTWGEGNWQVPERGAVTMTDFCKNYYGFVAARP